MIARDAAAYADRAAASGPAGTPGAPTHRERPADLQTGRPAHQARTPAPVLDWTRPYCAESPLGVSNRDQHAWRP